MPFGVHRYHIAFDRGELVTYKVLECYPGTVDEAAWRDCLANSDDASHYTSPDFFLEPWFRESRAFAILAIVDARVDGVLTGVMSGGVAECGLAVRPQLSRRRSCNQAIVDEVLAEGLLSLPTRESGLLKVYSWEPLLAFDGRGFSSRINQEETILLDLSLGPDALFAQFNATRRNMIRRAKREGVIVLPYSHESDFREYYELYQNWCAFKRLPAQPRDVQQQALSSRNRLTLVARHKGNIVGSSIFRFQRGGLIEYAANISRRKESVVGHNDLLLWSGIEWACREGFLKLSLGGAHFYLQSFGGKTVPTYSYRLDRTAFRRHNLRDGVRGTLSMAFRALPSQLQAVIRRVLRRQ